MVGTTISHYKVIEKIGQGGMGEVYRATDTNLSRDVAIKVLPEQFTKDPQRLARFEREAKLLASLNHPNIAAIYGFEEADDVRFLAMELVPGETLAERVAKGPVPVEEALEVCRQIAEGVEAAHEKGVIHRDLKPANVKVTPEGKVKILDFGLAKAFEGEVPAADISQSPTLTEEMTRAGVIMGTAAYMSPEQAKGKPVDKRADIFAFGAILYELLTGKRAFEGETITETLGAIIHKEPDWAILPETTPSIIQVLLRQCLQKNADSRLRDIADFQALSEATLAPVEPISEVQPGQQRWTVAVGLVVLGAVIAGLAFWLIQPSSPEQSLNRFVIRPSPPAILSARAGRDIAISPDGRNLVYFVSGEGVDRLYLRSLDDFVDRLIPGTEAAEASTFFSPDGESVGFFAAGKLYKVSLAGGSPIILGDVQTPMRSGSWVEDTIFFSGTGESDHSLYRMPAAGGEPEVLATVNRDEGERSYGYPQLLPDGETLLFSVQFSSGEAQIAALSLETKEQKLVLENADQARYLPTGHLIYEQPGTGNLMAAPFDSAGLEVTGDQVPVVQGVRRTPLNHVDYTISDNGTLVYVPDGGTTLHEHSLVWVDRDGTETSVTEEKREFRAPRISPDGKQIAMIIGVPAVGAQIWIYDIPTDSFSRLTFEEQRSGSSAWSPDSKWLIFQSGDSGEGGMVRQPFDGSLPPERLTSTPNRQMPNSWSSDGQFLAFIEGTSSVTGTFDIGILPLEGEEPDYIVATPAMECCPKFSPDGKWIAYISDESGRIQVYVRPFRGPDVKRLISDEEEGGTQPVWSPDGTELFYLSGNKMMVASIQAKDQTLVAGKPRKLCEGSYVSHSNPPGYQYYDISPDGKRFLMMKEGPIQNQAQINVILNWFEELKRLVPTN